MLSGIILMATTLLLYAVFWKVILHAADHEPGIHVRRAMLLYATWIAGVCALGESQFFADFSGTPLLLLFFLLLIVVCVALFARSATAHAIAEHTPLWALVGFQGFRIFAEWSLYEGYQEGLFPVQMTFEGLNFDIVSGIAAIIAIPLLRRAQVSPKLVAWFFNIVGIGLLLTILIIALTSTPTILRYFMNEPANTAVATMPHILLPGVLVHAAMVGHVLLTMKLVKAPRSHF